MKINYLKLTLSSFKNGAPEDPPNFLHFKQAI